MEILVVEDNPGDVRLILEALREQANQQIVHVAWDGEDALRFLRRETPHATARRPHLVLLDLNIPRKNGREVLAEIKNDSKLHAIPVVVLTTSRAEEDIRRSYELHANCYVSKPVEFDTFIELVRGIDQFWLEAPRSATA